MARRATLDAVHPVLPSRDVARAVAFYVERLGFALLWSDERYAVIRRDGVELHIQWHDPSEWIAGVDRPMLRFSVPAVDVLFAEYATAGVFHELTALRDTPWGTREFAFYDPDHNGLTFYRDVESG
jgi:catechol 2,3-dioxygenase-like lactoylglutathione lyase family enzyme